MKHTPRPWTATSEGDAYDISAWDDDGTVHIADVCISASKSPDVENEANARLIATAPELLEALEKVQSFIADWRDGKVQDMYLEELKYVVVDDAIAKARGE